MKILMVTRGSQGDIYPYLTVASELVKRGHDVTLSLPHIFEKEAKAFRLNYVLQAFDDIGGMLEESAETSQKNKLLLKWTRRVIGKQFEELIPLLLQHDIMVAANTEFSAASVAEFCRKPFIRTAFAPFIPGEKIPPPMTPFPKPGKIIRPALLWKLLNVATNFMVKKTLNGHRSQRGLPLIDNFGLHSVKNANNYLMFSRYLDSIDPDWKYSWQVGGYCFCDDLKYDEAYFDEVMRFIRKDERPVLFFTLGSCGDKNRNRFCERLLKICNEEGYKLVVGSGWSKTGEHLKNDGSLCVLEKPIPHILIFPHCRAVIHHGGAGTTHSAARAGVPQMIVPLILDQNHWGYRTARLGLGPERINIARIKEKQLRRAVNDLMNNAGYREKAAAIGEKIRGEEGVKNMCDYIESFTKR